MPIYLRTCLASLSFLLVAGCITVQTRVPPPAHGKCPETGGPVSFDWLAVEIANCDEACTGWADYGYCGRFCYDNKCYMNGCQSN
jgi:hypothetical protein